jgi:hypothetical protein
MNSEIGKSNEKELFRSRLKLVLIFSLFLGPLLVAFVWYYGLGAIFTPEGKANHAPLVSPVVTLVPFENRLHDDGIITLDSLRQKWTILHFIGSQCEEQCQKALYNTRQTRLALGKDAGRLQRYVVVDDPILAEDIQRNHADAVLVRPSQKGLQIQLQQLIEPQQHGVNDGILLDPLGNAMMYVPVNLDPGLLLKDLKKLFKLSHIG